MASKKAKKSRTRKNTASRKSRLWLRDLLNILGGLTVGALGVLMVQGYLADRSEKGVSERYQSAVREELRNLENASSGYEAMDADEQDPSGAIRGVDLTVALYRLDAYGTLHEDLSDLDSDAGPLLLSFYINLRDAELLRKLVIENREHPEQMSQILSREFLRTLQEATELAPRLLWALGRNPEPGETP